MSGGLPRATATQRYGCCTWLRHLGRRYAYVPATPMTIPSNMSPYNVESFPILHLEIAEHFRAVVMLACTCPQKATNKREMRNVGPVCQLFQAVKALPLCQLYYNCPNQRCRTVGRRVRATALVPAGWPDFTQACVQTSRCSAIKLSLKLIDEEAYRMPIGNRAARRWCTSNLHSCYPYTNNTNYHKIRMRDQHKGAVPAM